jgi:hypothetical protein
MFTFHDNETDLPEGNILAVTLQGAIASEYHSKVELKHCDFASDIIWGEENLCATVHSMKLDLALFIITNKAQFNVNSIIVVASKDSGVSEISLLKGKHIEPLEYIALLTEGETQSTDTGESQDGDNDSAED